MVSEKFHIISLSCISFSCRWGILLVSLWTQLGLVPGMHVKDGNVSPLSREDVLLLRDEQDPKCFTRTERDFTCFFETADNRTCDFFYWGFLLGKKRCELAVQRTEEGTFLHVCSFPDSDVRLFLETNLEVVEHHTNTSLYKRNVSVEDHLLLDPPFGVSLHQNDQAGQLRVSWQSKISEYHRDNVMYRLRYSSKRLGEKTTEVKGSVVLDSLVPGEEVQVQVAIKYALNSKAGHWSHWSHPARAVVPQSADDISLTCSTSDRRNVICRWDGSRYEDEHKLFYRLDLSETMGWTYWTECLSEGPLMTMCSFHGDEHRKVRVKLDGTPNPLGRTFYTREFTLNNSIKTSPPIHLRRELEKDRLCLKWDAPVQFLSAHLQYEVSYQIRGGETWMMAPIHGPETGACLKVPTGNQYKIKIRAKPTGSTYSGYWSDWSDVITGDSQTVDTLLILCIPILMLTAAVILISVFPSYLSKIKLYIWPPVPNLEKVLQGFLAEMDGQRWEPPLTAKQSCEETTSSVVEIVSEDEVTGSGKPSDLTSQLLSSEKSFTTRDLGVGGPGSETFLDYVTLNNDIIFPKGNQYVNHYETDMYRKDSSVLKHVEKRGSSCNDGLGSSEPSFFSNLLNHSYLPTTESADRCKVTAGRGAGNLYTNLPCH
ncbi:thrombopoietin receptor [Antennarius striatus]|uniref:thrombopoietin receptor n=1 Tax=Antennarius striatus TaxID=241820 RepID=UPI0035B4C4B2